MLYPWTDEITASDKKEAAEAGLFFANDKGNPERFSVPLADLAKLRELLNRAQYNRGSMVMFNQLLWRQAFTYDANGNRATKTSPWGTIKYEYDKENRLVKKGDIVYTYDMDGNLLSETGGYRSAAYRYNGQNRMAYSEVTDHTNGAIAVSEYAYDAFGRRTIAQEAGRTAMRTLYDGFTFEAIRESETFGYGGFTVRTSPGAVLPAVPSTTPGIVEEGRFRQVTEGYSRWLGNSPPQGGSGGDAAVPEYRYVGINATLYANGEAVAVNRLNTDTYTGGTVYLGKDILGSVRGISNDYGLLEERYEYDAFGKPYKGNLNNGMNLGYTGKPYDTATGLYNYGYRDYQPEVARFTTVDPIRDGSNWFAYVNNDPVNYVDLWGLECPKASDKASKINEETLIKGIYDTAVGGLKVIGGAGVIVSTGAAGFLFGGLTAVDGYVQFSIGLAEIAAALSNAPSANIPNSMSEILGIAGDAVKNAATGDNSTTFQDLGKWVGSQPAGILDMFWHPEIPSAT